MDIDIGEYIVSGFSTPLGIVVNVLLKQIDHWRVVREIPVGVQA